MNTNTNTSSSMSPTANKFQPATKSVSQTEKSTDSKIPSIAGISLPEIAILGAAGYVLWRNRSKVQSFLEQNGIEVPAVLSGDFSDLLQKGAKSLGGKDGQADRMQSSSQGNDSVRRHDA